MARKAPPCAWPFFASVKLKWKILREVIIIFWREHFQRRIFFNFHFARINFYMRKTPLNLIFHGALILIFEKKITLGTIISWRENF
jgi:hypothetical protein